MKTIFDVGTDEERVREDGAFRSPSRSSPPITSTTAAPTLVGDGHTKIMRASPAFLGCPSSIRCGAGEVETKGGADFMGQSCAWPSKKRRGNLSPGLFSNLLVKKTFTEEFINF